MWDALLAVVEPKVQPVGWDAWRAAGIAAGLPWDGADLGGPFDISPVQAGYGELIALHKPFFVGRSGLLARAFPPEVQIARFSLVDADPDNPAGIRFGTPIVDEAGVCVGHVTSYSPISAEPNGLGLIAKASTAPGTRLGILDGASLGRPTRIGDQLTGASTIATIEVQTRFPK